MKLLPRLLAVCAIPFLSAASLQAQTAVAVGATHEHAGLAMIKPQAWSKPDQATVLEFQAVENRSGYYQFRTASNPANQVQAARVVSVIFFPSTPDQIISNDERAGLQKMIDELAGSAAKFPQAARLIDRALAPLKGDAAKFDSGNIKENSGWTARATYFQKKAAAVAELLRPEMVAASRITDFDLATSHYFISLRELTDAEPSARPVLARIQALYDSMLRKETRADILRQINAGRITLEQATELVAKLKALRPEEDAPANLFVQGWETTVAKAAKLTDRINALGVRFEESIAKPAEPDAAPIVPPALAADVGEMSDEVRQFRASSPPPMIRVPLSLADAMSAFVEKLPTLGELAAARELIQAKEILDTIVGQAALIGSKTSSSLDGIKKYVNSELGKFVVLRDEAKMLADNGKAEEAQKKYQQAYAILPAKEIAERMDALKKK